MITGFCRVENIDKLPLPGQGRWRIDEKGMDFNPFAVYDFRARSGEADVATLRGKKMFPDKEELLAEQKRLNRLPDSVLVYYALRRAN